MAQHARPLVHAGFFETVLGVALFRLLRGHAKMRGQTLDVRRLGMNVRIGAAVARALQAVVLNFPHGSAFSPDRSEEHTSELQSLMRISYAVFCLKKTKKRQHTMKYDSHNKR